MLYVRESALGNVYGRHMLRIRNALSARLVNGDHPGKSVYSFRCLRDMTRSINVRTSCPISIFHLPLLPQATYPCPIPTPLRCYPINYIFILFLLHLGANCRLCVCVCAWLRCAAHIGNLLKAENNFAHFSWFYARSFAVQSKLILWFENVSGITSNVD